MTEKPWGHEEILYTDNKYTVKRLFMKAGECCSLQYHIKKQETIYVISGMLKIMDRVFYPNEYITIKPGEIHRMEGVIDSVYIECSTSELDDCVKMEDKYGRK